MVRYDAPALKFLVTWQKQTTQYEFSESDNKQENETYS